MTEEPDRQPEQPGQQRHADRTDGDEDDQQPAVAGEQAAEGQHGAQVGDEARGEDEFAEVVPVQPGFHHHRVDHRHRRGAQRDPADLGGVQVPAQHQPAERERAEERQRERDRADGQARLPVPAQRHRVDLRPGQERQHQGTRAGQERDHVGLGDVLLDAGDVAGQRADHDLHQCRRHRDLDADHRREQGHAYPDRGHVVRVHRRSCQVWSWQQPAADRRLMPGRCVPGRSHQPRWRFGRRAHRSFIRRPRIIAGPPAKTLEPPAKASKRCPWVVTLGVCTTSTFW